MSNFYKKNDDFLRDKLNNHEFDAVPGAWENMSKMLNKQKMIQTGGSNSLWWSIPTFSAVVLTAIIGTGIYIKSNQNKQAASTISTKKEAITLATNEANNKNLVTSNNSADLDTNNSVVLTDDSSTEQKNMNLTAVSDNIVQSDATHTNNQNTSIAEEEQIFEGIYESLDNASPSTSSDKKSIVKTSQTTQIVNNSDTKKASDDDIAVFRAYLNQNTQQSLPANPTNKNEVAEEDASAQNTAMNSMDNTTKNNIEDVVEKPSGKRSKTVIINQFSYSTFLKKQKVTKIKDNTEPVNFGIKTALNNPNSCPLKFSLYAGLNTQMMMQVNEFSFSPVAGLSTTYKFAPRHSLRLGLQYKGVSRKDNQADMENTELRYDSGINSSKSYLLKRLDLLEVPLSYQFYFSPYFNITTGLKCSWIINHESSNPAFNQMSLPQLGLSNFELGLLLGLEFNINKHFCLAIQYNQGLTNMSKLGHEKEQKIMQDEANIGINSIEKQQALTNEGEIAVPVETTTNQQQFVRLPYQLYNNDILLLLRYTF